MKVTKSLQGFLIFTNFTSIHVGFLVAMSSIMPAFESPLLESAFYYIYGVHAAIVVLVLFAHFAKFEHDSNPYKTIDMIITFAYFGAIFKCQVNYVNEDNKIS